MRYYCAVDHLVKYTAFHIPALETYPPQPAGAFIPHKDRASCAAVLA